MLSVVNVALQAFALARPLLEVAQEILRDAPHITEEEARSRLDKAFEFSKDMQFLNLQNALDRTK